MSEACSSARRAPMSRPASSTPAGHLPGSDGWCHRQKVSWGDAWFQTSPMAPLTLDPAVDRRVPVIRTRPSAVDLLVVMDDGRLGRVDGILLGVVGGRVPAHVERGRADALVARANAIAT